MTGLPEFLKIVAKKMIGDFLSFCHPVDCILFCRQYISFGQCCNHNKNRAGIKKYAKNSDDCGGLGIVCHGNIDESSKLFVNLGKGYQLGEIFKVNTK